MSDSPSSRHDEIVSYILKCVTRLSSAWNSEKANNSGLRAHFRRWSPHGADRSSSLEMQSAIWEMIGPFGGEGPAGPEDIPSTDQIETIERAAIIVALRAIAGDGTSTRSFGAALHDAKVSDLRLMRLLTTPESQRLEAAIRAVKRLDAAGVPFEWNWKGIRRFYDFLFEGEERAQRAITEWAADFFRARGRQSAETETTNATTTDQTTANQEQPS